MLNHIGTQLLQTPRLTLRPFTLGDAGAMYRNWASDPEVTKFLTWPTHTCEAVSAAVLEDWVSGYKNPDFYQWAIVPADFGEPIGSISAVKYDDTLDMVHIGYCIGQNWWHKGITSEALAAVMDFFFHRVGANRIEAGHDTNNPHSGSVMRKCAMRYEGTHRQAARNNQGICDVCWYAALKEDR